MNRRVSTLAGALFLIGCAGLPEVRSDVPASPGGGAVTLKPAGRLPPPDGARLDPHALAVDARGRVLVADLQRGAVFAYDDRGRPGSWLPEPPATSMGPRYEDIRSVVAAPGLFTYILDGGTGHVHSYDITGRYQGRVLNLDRDRVRPLGFGLDRTGRAIVTDGLMDQLLVFDPQWSPSHVIGGPGDSGGNFRDPVDVAFDRRDRMIVADQGNRLVQFLSPQGEFLREVRLIRAPESVEADHAGNVFVGDAEGWITVLGEDGRRSELPPGEPPPGPAFLALSPDEDRLYVSRPARGWIEILDIVPAGASP